MAVKDEEPLTWDFSNGEYTLPISIVSPDLFNLNGFSQLSKGT